MLEHAKSILESLSQHGNIDDFAHVFLSMETDMKECLEMSESAQNETWLTEADDAVSEKGPISEDEVSETERKSSA
jgi:hypothetical protein